ncbi:CvpA family protein [Halarsenatibacter silvermanii]|uniref:Membrane protein required for colicin V production n=1 Tax=Halarsenatibacter silvermanii TaxID=321763 RepID=A0A1G9K3L9_9FIRM|nr:CvpA family protein [Halarsenatibacter silvermanii]SDL43833.1 membrane protein required for colicin V production [Halarsenatibacter silvermanii]
MNGLSLLDIFISLIILYFLVSGYRNGFISQTATIVGIIVSVYVAFKFYLPLADFAANYFDFSPAVIQFISFSLIFIIINVAVHMLGESLQAALEKFYLEPVDRAGGFILGAVKGVLLAYILVLVLNEIPITEVETFVENSHLAERFTELTPIFQDIIGDILD